MGNAAIVLALLLVVLLRHRWAGSLAPVPVDLTPEPGRYAALERVVLGSPPTFADTESVHPGVVEPAKPDPACVFPGAASTQRASVEGLAVTIGAGMDSARPV